MSDRDARMDLLLQQVKHDLRHLPRHQWDNYLWNFCREFVQFRGADSLSEPPGEDSSNSSF